MRAMAVVLVVCVLGCTPDRKWVVISPGDAPKGGQVFVTVDANAIHMRSTKIEGTRLTGEVVEAWVVPKGVPLRETTASPKTVANFFGWAPSTAIAKTRIGIELAQVQSSVYLMDEDWKESDDGGGSGAMAAGVILLFPIAVIFGVFLVCAADGGCFSPMM